MISCNIKTNYSHAGNKNKHNQIDLEKKSCNEVVGGGNGKKTKLKKKKHFNNPKYICVKILKM